MGVGTRSSIHILNYNKCALKIYGNLGSDTPNTYFAVVPIIPVDAPYHQFIYCCHRIG